VWKSNAGNLTQAPNSWRKNAKGFLLYDLWMTKPELLQALQREIRKHSFETFVDDPPSAARGGWGVVVPGCPACRKRINSMAQFVGHLADDVLPGVVDRLNL
jgi:hypothetical protein